MLRTASAQRKKIATILSFIAIPLSGFITDIYLPSFPAMAKSLQATEQDIQLTLTFFFLSYGIAQLFVGSWLDSIGRYKASLFSLGFIVLTSLLISATDQVYFIYGLRAIQGIATAFLIVAKRAFFMDLYEDEKRKHYLSYFTIVWSCGPILAPFLGGYLQKLWGWNANFYFLAIYGIVLLVLEITYGGETIAQKKTFNMQKIIEQYKVILSHRYFVFGIFILGLSYSVAMVFNISGPFVIESSFHFGPVIVGYVTLVLGFAWMVGGIVSRRLIASDLTTRVTTATIVQLLLTGVLLISGIYLQNLPVFVLLAFLIHACSGFLYNIYFTNNMLYFPNNAGIAGGLIGGLVYIITSFSSFLIASIGKISTQNDMGLRYLVASALLLGVVRYSLRKEKRKKQLS